MKIRDINIFEIDKNKKGDLFGRLMADLFHALGYGKPRFNIHKTGRELDIQVEHRMEDKIAIAECKAHKDTIGGSDLNKFYGALSSEKNKQSKINTNQMDIVGYFISLSGFKETAIEQEKENDNKRMILIDGKRVIDELIAGKIIVSIEQAVSKIPIQIELTLFDEVDMIASEIGWIWVFYYGNNQQITHFTLVHAEGNLLVEKLAQEIIDIDKKLNYLFKDLIYIKPFDTNNILSSVEEAKEEYFKYIENECGEIQFEGLPTDKDAGSVKVKLENIFEPLHLEEIKDTNNLLFDLKRQKFGSILEKNNRLAILAKPGGGKSTLIKRVAVAYAYPEKIKLVPDFLPEKDYFPIFIRCRDLGQYVTSSITDIIYNIPNKAEIEHLKDGFYKISSEALQSGKALLLIDGLDEISNDRDRIKFVNQLRIFLATYPNVSIITTSRKAGFRAIGGILADYCSKYEIANLSEDEIRELSKKWHIAIIDNSNNTIKESNELVEQILSDRRIKALAENPLLLTTLLFVKRWAGYLPTKRHILYQEMIKLLLVTWNVEGHEQLDIDETEPQLSFVAYWMSQNGKQTITESELKECLADARKQMPDILCYTKISVSDFIKRVESRSSILIMSGHTQLEDDSVVPVYEFLHLSFQEYLTAKAVVEKWLPKELDKNNNLEILKSYIFQENWKEVIPLVAVLSKRGNKELIEYLIQESKQTFLKKDIGLIKKQSLPPLLLGSCIANEIQINPDLLAEALEWYAKNRFNLHNESLTEIIIKGKFGIVFENVIKEKFFDIYDDRFGTELGGLLGEIYRIKSVHNNKCEVLKSIESQILSNDKIECCIGISALMNYAFENVKIKKSEICELDEYKVIIKNILNILFKLLKLKDKHYSLLIPWAVAWIFNNEEMFKEIGVNDEFLCELINNWLENEEFNISRFSAWALETVFSSNKNIIKYLKQIDSIENKILNKYNKSENEYDKRISIYLGTELGIKWNINELENFFNKNGKRNNRLFRLYTKRLGITVKKEEENFLEIDN